MTEPIDLQANVDEVHSAVLDMIPPNLTDLSSIEGGRAVAAGLLDALPAPELPADVEIAEVMVPGFGDDPEVRVKTYRPVGMASGAGALLWIHGGGMVLFSADLDDARCATYASQMGIFVASVDHRLAPETTAPGLVHDCYAALTWLADSAVELGIDDGNLMIGGSSSGGGLAAGTALFARDQGGPTPVAQLLVWPMIDHSNTTPSSHMVTDMRVWNRETNIIAWDAYLGGGEATIYSSPSIATRAELEGLPPAFIPVGQLDMFLDENIAYARDLMAAGVPCELVVYPGMFHGSSIFAPTHPLSQRFEADQAAFIARSLGLG